MTPVPPPASPCMRVRLIYTQTDGFEGGNRFYLSYAGSSPTGANCTAIAAAIEAAWVSDLAGQVNEEWALTEVDVLDIATETGLSGQWTGSEAGIRGGTSLPAQCATNIEFGISRRYRGGKPRMFLPPPVSADQLSAGQFNSSFITQMNTNIGEFFSAVQAIDVGAVGALTHVNLSYYKGFTNVTNSSGRERAVPTYRDDALLDTVVGYSTKGMIGSQRRRRLATTP